MKFPCSRRHGFSCHTDSWGVPVPSPFTIQTTPHTCPVLGCEFPPPDITKASPPGSAQPIAPNQLLIPRDYGRTPSSIPHRERLLVQARGTKFRRSSIQF